MDLIADTNVWYDIGAGRRDPVTLKANGNRLVATPISLLEIASLIDDRNLTERKNAAIAVVNHADAIADDSEYHLACIWELNAQEHNVPWGEAFKAIAGAHSRAEIVAGVDDFADMVKRKINLPLAKYWRSYHWDDFRDKVIIAIDQHVPGYKRARDQGKIKHLNKGDGEIFANTIRSAQVRKIIVETTFQRALLVAGEPNRRPTDAEYHQAEPSVAPYVDAYIEYMIGCATAFAPQSNDLGDSESFLYLQNNRAFLSSDKRWVCIARNACPANFCDPENKVP
jgi:hypothetical protein